MTKLTFKTQKTLFALAVIGMISFSSCEKEPEMSPNQGSNASNTTNTSDSKNLDFGNSDKSGEWDDLPSFISDVMTGAELSDMLIEKSLYYTEATLDWRLSGRDDILSSRVDGAELTYTVSTFVDPDGDVRISASDLSQLNGDIHDDIATQAGNLATDLSNSITVDNIDLNWDIDLGSNITTITVNTLYGVVGGTLRCFGIFSDAKVITQEKCVGTPYHNAAVEIDGFTRTFCGTWNRKLTCDPNTHAYVNVRISTVSGLTPVGYFLWNGSNPNECRTATQNLNDFNSSRAIWNNQTIPFPGSNLKSCRFWPIWNNLTNLGHHVVSYTTANCIRICPDDFAGCEAIHRPGPVYN